MEVYVFHSVVWLRCSVVYKRRSNLQCSRTVCASRDLTGIKEAQPWKVSQTRSCGFCDFQILDLCYLRAKPRSEINYPIRVLKVVLFRV